MHVVRQLLIAGLIVACLLAVPALGSETSTGDMPASESREDLGKRGDEKQQSEGHLLSSSNGTPAQDFPGQLNLPKDPDAVLREILSREEFQHALKETRWDQIQKWLEQILLSILRWIAGKIGFFADKESFDAHPLWRVAEGMLIGAVFLLALYLAKILFEHLRDHTSPPANHSTARGADSQYLSSDRLREEARQCAQRGDYRTGLILLFRSVLVRLEEEGKIGHHRGKTNREVIRSISGEGVARELVTQLVPVFDGVCYGNAPCGKEEYERFLRQCTRLIQGG